MNARHDEHVRDWRGAGPIETDARAYEAGVRRGFWTAAALYVVATLVLIGIFHALGVRP